MEVHPILETSIDPNPGLWYVVSGFGECPSMRVGHSAVHVPSQSGNGTIYIIGGANPSGPFSEVYKLDLDTFSWDVVETEGFKARYEHAIFVPKSQPTKIYIVGGAEQVGNLNDVQVFDLVTKTWETLKVKGQAPPARTFHNSVTVGDNFYMYSGGLSGAEPVTDRQVRCFDATTATWSSLNLKGDSPKPRHGHVMVAIGKKIFIHGGMSGVTFYDDLHLLDLDAMTWHSVKKKKVWPPARAAHGGVAIGNHFYIFGGMNKDGALDDMYRLDTGNMTWAKVSLEGTPPANRLDFAICPLTLEMTIDGSTNGDVTKACDQVAEVLGTKLDDLKVKDDDDSPGAADNVTNVMLDTDGTYLPTDGSTEETPENQIKKKVKFIYIHGGMDTQGNIFDDGLALAVADSD